MDRIATRPSSPRKPGRRRKSPQDESQAEPPKPSPTMPHHRRAGMRTSRLKSKTSQETSQDTLVSDGTWSEQGPEQDTLVSAPFSFCTLQFSILQFAFCLPRPVSGRRGRTSEHKPPLSGKTDTPTCGFNEKKWKKTRQGTFFLLACTQWLRHMSRRHWPTYVGAYPLRLCGIRQMKRHVLAHGRGVTGQRIHGKICPLAAFQL